MPAPTNISAATATVIPSLPFFAVQDVNFAGTTYTVWYAYTAVVTEVAIGVFGFGDLTVYTPRTLVYIGPSSAPVLYLDLDALNKPVQLPVTAGVTYYFEFRKNANVTPAQLRVDVKTAPTAASSTPGAVERFVHPFPAGEAGDILVDGTMLVEDRGGASIVVKVYDAAFALVNTVSFGTTGIFQIRTHDPTQKWYIGRSGGGAAHATVTTVMASGALGPTTWTLPDIGLTGMAASVNESILYYTGTGSSLASPVHRWDLVNNVALSDLAAGVAGYINADLFVLPDGTVLVSYVDQSVPRDLFVRRYSAAGAVLHTYAFGSDQGATTPRMARPLEWPDAFWIWRHPASTPGMSLFSLVQISDGSAITSFTVPEYENGIFEPPATATPPRFGISFSCPFLVLPTGSIFVPDDTPDFPGVMIATGTLPVPPVPPGPGGTPTVRKMRRMRQSPHVWDGEQGFAVGYPGFELLAEVGGPRDDPAEPNHFELQYSDDGGWTWSNLRIATGDKLGQYRYRYRWTRLGTGRDRIFRVVNSDSAKVVLIDALLVPDPTPGKH